MAKDITREEWLNKVANRMTPWFEKEGAPLPKFRVSIGFTSGGKRAKAIGECWDAKCSVDGTYEIFFRPDLSDPVQVAATLNHELCHAALGIKEGHGRKFKKLATAMGLTGKMTATVAGPEFKERIAPILEKVGPLPHATLKFAGVSSAPKKQTTRLLKAQCGCGYTVRVTQKWIDEAGAPHCPLHGEMEIG